MEAALEQTKAAQKQYFPYNIQQQHKAYFILPSIACVVADSYLSMSLSFSLSISLSISLFFVSSDLQKNKYQHDG